MVWQICDVCVVDDWYYVVFVVVFEVDVFQYDYFVVVVDFVECVCEDVVWVECIVGEELFVCVYDVCGCVQQVFVCGIVVGLV